MKETGQLFLSMSHNTPFECRRTCQSSSLLSVARLYQQVTGDEAANIPAFTFP